MSENTIEIRLNNIESQFEKLHDRINSAMKAVEKSYRLLCDKLMDLSEDLTEMSGGLGAENNIFSST